MSTYTRAFRNNSTDTMDIGSIERNLGLIDRSCNAAVKNYELDKPSEPPVLTSGSPPRTPKQYTSITNDQKTPTFHSSSPETAFSPFFDSSPRSSSISRASSVSNLSSFYESPLAKRGRDASFAPPPKPTALTQGTPPSANRKRRIVLISENEQPDITKYVAEEVRRVAAKSWTYQWLLDSRIPFSLEPPVQQSRYMDTVDLESELDEEDALCEDPKPEDRYDPGCYFKSILQVCYDNPAPKISRRTGNAAKNVFCCEGPSKQKNHSLLSVNAEFLDASLRGFELFVHLPENDFQNIGHVIKLLPKLIYSENFRCMVQPQIRYFAYLPSNSEYFEISEHLFETFNNGNAQEDSCHRHHCFRHRQTWNLLRYSKYEKISAGRGDTKDLSMAEIARARRKSAKENRDKRLVQAAKTWQE